MLVVITHRDRAVSLDADAARRLADMGIVSVAIAADQTTEAIVLEGWAFDPSTSGADAAEILVGAGGRAQSLQPILQTLLPSSSEHPSE